MNSYFALLDVANNHIVLFIAAAAVLVIGGIVFTVLRNKKIKENGVEAAAVVSRIEIERELSDDGHSNEKEKYYVTYTNAEGQTVEAVLGNPPARARVGTELKIKYLPEKPKYVIYVKE